MPMRMGALKVADTADRAPRLIPLAPQAAGMLDQAQPRRCGGGARPAAREQALAQFGLEALDAAGHGRLRQAEPFCRPVEAVGLDEVEERVQKLDLQS